MNTAEVLAVLSPERAVFLRDCQTLIGITLLFWDHLLTLGQEVRLIWPGLRHLARSSFTYLILRYPALVAYFAILLAEVGDMVRVGGCPSFMLFRQLMLVWCHAIVYALLSVRVYALYGMRRSCLVTLLGLAAIVIAIAIWGIIYGSQKDPSIRPHCLSSGSDPSIVIRKAIAWEGLLFGDVILFVLTVYKTHRINQANGIGGGIPIVNLILRDGILFFAVMLLANAANVATFYIYTNTPGLSGSLSTFSSCISVCMMSRMSLNLHERVLLEGTTLDLRTSEMHFAGD